MAWTSPSLVATGDILTAAFWNAQVRENFLALAGTTGLIYPAVLATTSTWKLLYYNGSGAAQQLSIGAAGQVLASLGASTAPTFSNIAINLDTHRVMDY